jgi:hypothetical protein
VTDPLPPLPTEWRACLVCHRVLEAFRDTVTGKLTWDHTAMDRADGVNHPPVPVAYSTLGGEDAVRTRCDFCGGYDPNWELPVNDFSMVRHGEDWGSSARWLACDTCADFLVRSDWPGLTRRAAEASARRTGTNLTIALADLAPLYRKVRQNQRGALRTIHPLGRRPAPAITTTQALVELADLPMRPFDGNHRFASLRRQP